MRHLANAVLAAAVSVSVVACVPQMPKFRAGAPVASEKKALGHVYKQDGNAIDVGSLMAGLAQVDVAREDAKSARSYATGGAVLGGIGGVGLGYGLVTGLGGESSGWAIAAAGVAVTAVGMLVGAAADRRLDRAVQAYNGQLRPAASFPTVVPWLAPLPGAQDRCLAGGIAFRF